MHHLRRKTPNENKQFEAKKKTLMFDKPKLSRKISTKPRL